MIYLHTVKQYQIFLSNTINLHITTGFPATISIQQLFLHQGDTLAPYLFIICLN